jgi:predicted nucleic acid-binding protein
VAKTDKVVILDTNILDYGTKKDLSADVAKLLEDLVSEGYKLTISAYELFEAYRGLNRDRIPSMNKLVAPFTPLEVDANTFRIAAALYTCYKSHSATRDSKHNDKPRNADDGDIVIAATSLHYNALVLTANGNDFPRPFFSEVGKSHTLKRKTNKAQIRVHLLQPEISVFNESLKDCLL